MDEKLVLNVWSDQLTTICDDNHVKVGVIRMSDFELMRDSYIEVHNNHWMLLQELIRVDMDNNHPLHSQASLAVDAYMKR